MSVYHFILSHLSRLGDTVGQGRAGLTMSNGDRVECPREENHESQKTPSDGRRRPGSSFVARAGSSLFLIQGRLFFFSK
jgi:hypothetical protein